MKGRLLFVRSRLHLVRFCSVASVDPWGTVVARTTCECSGRSCEYRLLSALTLWFRFVPPVSGSEVTCELEFTIPEDDKFFDDKVRHTVDYTTRRYQFGI